MRYWLFITYFLCVISICGCRPAQGPGRQKGPSVISELTVKDIMPRDMASANSSTEIRIFTFQIPQNEYYRVIEIFSKLHQEPIRFVNKQAFLANGFKCGFGKAINYNRIRSRLLDCGMKYIGSYNLFSFDNDSTDITIKEVHQPGSVFYTDTDGTVSGTELNAGRVVLQVSVNPSDRLKSVAEIRVGPVFEPFYKSNPLIKNLSSDGNIIFRPAAVAARLSVGDFILLGPEDYEPDDLSLKGLVFNHPQEGVVRVYMITCINVVN